MDFRNTLRVVSPTVDADVLRVLAGADAAFTGRQIHRLAGVASHEGIRRALQRLVAQGVVESEQVGRAFLYRLNRDHLAAAAIMTLSQLRQAFIQRLRDDLAGWSVQPHVAAIFGSVARGEATEESDVDLFLVRASGVDTDAPDWRAQIVGIESRASRWTGNDVRVLEYGLDEFRRLRRTEPVLAEAMREGIVLVGTWDTP
jgi:predicted nucleotidyltransferase